jgi:hypothetical protein
MVSREAKSPIDSLLLFLIHPVAAQHRKSPFIDIILEHGSVGTYSGGPTASSSAYYKHTSIGVCVCVFFPHVCARDWLRNYLYLSEEVPAVSTQFMPLEPWVNCCGQSNA